MDAPSVLGEALRGGAATTLEPLTPLESNAARQSMGPYRERSGTSLVGAINALKAIHRFKLCTVRGYDGEMLTIHDVV